MVLNTCKVRSNGIKIAFIFQKVTNIAQRLGASPPDPVCDDFELHYFTQQVSQVVLLHF